MGSEITGRVLSTANRTKLQMHYDKHRFFDETRLVAKLSMFKTYITNQKTVIL